MSNIILPKSFSIPIIQRPVDDSCVLWISGRTRDSNTYIRDLSKYRNTGTISGASWGNTPLNHPCLNFDGVDDYVDIPSSSVYKPASTMTIEAWVYPRSAPSADCNKILNLAYRADGANISPYSAWAIDGYGSYLQFRVVWAVTGSPIFLMSGINLTLNAWSHVVATFDGTTVRSYVNNMAGNTTSLIGNIDYGTSQELTIGAFNPDSLLFPWDGLIDEVRIYNRALSAQEIREHFENVKYLYGY